MLGEAFLMLTKFSTMTAEGEPAEDDLEPRWGYLEFASGDPPREFGVADEVVVPGEHPGPTRDGRLALLVEHKWAGRDRYLVCETD